MFTTWLVRASRHSEDTTIYQPEKGSKFSAVLDEFKLLAPESCEDDGVLFIDPMGEMTLEQIEDFANGLLSLVEHHKLNLR